jgi:hypothetical protein
MPHDIDLRGHQARVHIRVAGYENAEASNADDANWLTCAVSVEAGGCSARLGAAFTTHEFARLLASLDGALAGSGQPAAFQAFEEALEFRVTVPAAGAARVTGTAKEIAAVRATLEFSFETDRGFLRETRAMLRDVVSAFPPRG